MVLTPGQTLAHYQIVGALGAGAMGEVWRARDTRLGREVAVKVLPEHFADDEERLRRFEREAQSLAALNHPNVAQIHGVDQVGDTCFLVLELVPGESLEERLRRGRLPLEEALDVCRQIAAGLEAAHEAGVIHRDLKPANVRLTPGGDVKVLDFGLAKPANEGGQGSSTDSVLATEAGRLLGTPTYMAPEQARGKSIDKRVDVWAFGCVLFECLTGKRAFAGETLTDVLGAVIHTEADLAQLPPGVPVDVRALLARCLTKDPRQRLRDVGDARLVLERPGAAALPSASAASGGPALGRALPWALSALLVVALAVVSLRAFGAARSGTPPAAPAAARSALHVGFVLPDGDEVTALKERPLAIAPDGGEVVYVGLRDGKTQLFLRPLARGEPRPIDGTEGAKTPFFSPDGRWLAFFADGKLKKVTVDGAAVEAIADAPYARGGCWGADDVITFAPTNVSGLLRVPASGGAVTELTTLDRAAGEISHRWPYALPDGKTLLFSSWTGPGPDERQIVRLSLAAGGERRVLLRGADSPQLVDGRLVYARLDALYAVPWSPTAVDLAGVVPIALPEFPRNEGEGSAAFALASNGSLAYLAGGKARRVARLVWLERSGASEPLPLPDREYESAAISPDGRQAVVQVQEGTTGLWLLDFGRGTLTPFVTSGGSSQAPLWTPDGKGILYRKTREGFRNIYWKAADGTGEELRLTAKAGVVQTPMSVSPDGRWLVLNEGGRRPPGTEIWRMPLEDRGAGHPEPVDEGACVFVVQGGNGRVSPDGKWLAYEALVSGRSEIFVQPFLDPGPRHPISSAGGVTPLWSPDGRELFFTTNDRLLAVDVTTTPTFSAGAPRAVLEGRYRSSPNGNTPYDLTADGQRFLRVQQIEPDRAVTHVDLVLDGLAELGPGAARK